MGSEEAKENAEVGRGKRERVPSTKQIAAAEASELERKKLKKAPAKSAVESAEPSDGTVGSEFELSQSNSASSAKQRVNEPPEQTAAMTGKDKEEHDKNCHFCQGNKRITFACEADACTHRFCLYCLDVHLGIDTEAAASSSFKGTPWHCPTCSSKCCCSQPECTKAHRHCQVHLHRCRRAAERKEQSAFQKLYDAQCSDAGTGAAGEQALMPPPPPPPPNPPGRPMLNRQQKEEALQQKEEARQQKEEARQQKEEARAKAKPARKEAAKAAARAAAVAEAAYALELQTRKIAAQVTLWLNSQGMPDKCIDSLLTCGKAPWQKISLDWLERVRIYMANGMPEDEFVCCDMEGTDSCAPYAVSLWGLGGMTWTWALNPLSGGAEATLEQCQERFGYHLTFLRAYKFIMKEDLPAGDLLEMGQRYNDSAAMRRLHAAVVKLPTISASKDDILKVLKRFKCIHHWCGADGRWLRKIGCDIDIIDLGLIYQRFMVPVKSEIENAQGKRMYGASQAIACVALGGDLRPPHFSEADAQMCWSVFLELVSRVATQSYY